MKEDPLKGKKRHVLVDTEGLLMQAIVHAADVQDRDRAMGDRQPSSQFLQQSLGDNHLHFGTQMPLRGRPPRQVTPSGNGEIFLDNSLSIFRASRRNISAQPSG
jgi:hypothetical protein